MMKDPKPLKILVIRNDKIGDLVLTTPIFREIKKHFPKSQITLVVSKIAKPLVEKNTYIDRLIVLDHFKGWKLLSHYLKLSSWIKKEKFDIGFDMRGSRMNCLFFLWLPRIKHRISFSNFHNLSFFLTENIIFENIYDKHLTIESLEIINKGLKINATDNTPEIFTDKSDENCFNQFLREKNIRNRYICICPGGNYGKYKGFNELIRYINREYPKYNIILSGGEEDRKEIDNLLNNNKKCKKAINLNLRVIYLLFKNSCLVIAPDGGPMHMAGTAKVNLIALFGNTSPNHQRPLNKNSIILTPNGLVDYIKKNKNVPKKNGFEINMISIKELKLAIRNFLKK